MGAESSPLTGAEATPLVIRWPEADRPDTAADFLFGRRCFSYERLDLPLLEIEDHELRLHAPGQWLPISVDAPPAPSR